MQIILIDSIVYLLIGGLTAWLFFYLMRKDLLGGFTGGFIVGVIGAILGAFLLTDVISVLVEYLEEGLKVSNVNIIAAFLGAYGGVYVFNKINHDKQRD